MGFRSGQEGQSNENDGESLSYPHDGSYFLGFWLFEGSDRSFRSVGGTLGFTFSKVSGIVFPFLTLEGSPARISSTMSKWEVGLTEISGSLDLAGACGAELTLVRDRLGEPFLVDREY